MTFVMIIVGGFSYKILTEIKIVKFHPHTAVSQLIFTNIYFEPSIEIISTIQYTTVHYKTVDYTVQYSTVQYSIA